MVRRTSGASAGSRRGSQATTTRSASSSPAAVSTATTRPPRSTRSRTSLAVRTSTLRVASRADRASASTPMPPVTVHAPNRCSTYAVTPTHAGTSRGSWPSARLGWQRHQPEPLVLEASDPPRQRLAAPEPRGQRRGQVVGVPGTLEVLAAQHLPVVGVGRGRGRPSASRGRAPSASTAWICAAREPTAAGPRCRRRTGARAARPARPGRARARPAVPTCGTGRAPRPAAGCTPARRPRLNPSRSTGASAPPSRGPRSSRVTWWPSLASRAATAIPPNPPPTTATRAMRPSSVVGLTAGRGGPSSPSHRWSRRAVKARHETR